MIKRFFLSDKNMMVAIVINATIITLLYFPQCKGIVWLEWMDYLFILLFFVEAMVKLHVLKPKAYFVSNWNRFDFFIVMGSLPSLLLGLLPLPDTSLLILLRLFRLIRLIRFIGFVPHLSSIVAGLGRALKASVFVLIALFLLNFLLAIFTCHFYGGLVPEYFGDPLIASYSMFQLFTLEGWYEMPALIAERSDNAILIGATRFYFVMIVIMGGIFGLSLANAVFVDEMTMDNNAVLEKKIDSLGQEIQELKELLKKNQP